MEKEKKHPFCRSKTKVSYFGLKRSNGSKKIEIWIFNPDSPFKIQNSKFKIEIGVDSAQKFNVE